MYYRWVCIWYTLLQFDKILLNLYKIVSMILRIVSTLVLNAFVIHVDIFIRFGMMSIAVSCEVSHTILFFNIDGHMYSIPRNIRYMDMLYHCSWYLFRVVYFTATCISAFYCIADDFWVTWMAYMENYFTISCLCRCYQQNHKLHNYVYIFLFDQSGITLLPMRTKVRQTVSIFF